MSRIQRLELVLFVACLFAFAFFHQGGGWNQNARFAEVRAMAEEGRFAIDNFLIYQADRENGGIRRVPMQDAEYESHGKRFRLSWVDMSWNLFPVNESPAEPGVEKAPMVEVCSTGDIGYVPWTGHFHPNKPPGTSFLALPGYFLILQVEKLFGLSPDGWWTLTVNAWLTTVCSVGLCSALGCVIFFRLAREFAGGASLPAVLATLAFAFGTMFLPFGTLFFDHNLTAVFLLAAFYFMRRGMDSSRQTSNAERRAPNIQGRAPDGSEFDVRSSKLGVRRLPLFLAGLCAGIAAITNYIAAVGVIFLGLYLLLALSRRAPGFRPWAFNWRPSLLYTLGVVGPFLLICWYGWVCFGSPFKLSTDFQNPLFKDPRGAFLGMFAMPSAYVAALISVTPFRGIFFLSPVLLMALYGLVVWLREKTYAAEARLCLAMFVFFFLVNASFNGYHGGFGAGPRYLIPALPFLALPLVVAFARWRWLTGALAAISIGHQLLLTATDAQNPLAVGGHARIDGREDATYHLVADYAWPLFGYGRAWPILEELLAIHMSKEDDKLALQYPDETERLRRSQEYRRELREGMNRGDASPFLLAAIRGPVSVNPIGVYEGMFFQIDTHEHPRTAWNSFNIGEFFWPQSRWSILPLLLVSGGLSVLAILIARRRSDQKDA